ncbi:MAG: TIGR01212 family radical SAM protein [Prevotellaceae bacterium]|nr:TIGR01212 family radical SAM protein [Prevotellaceae bacterium]
MIYAWGDSRRFNSYAGYFRRTFGRRVQKLAIDAGFTCPNRDGTLAFNGCTYCNNKAFNPSYCDTAKTITQQINEGIEFHANRYRRAESFLAYFQAFSNTYASVEVLKQRYGEALAHPKVTGLVIGTRPDCVDEEILDFLAQISKTKYLIVEYGIESCYNQTLKRINRGHNFEKSVWAIETTAQRGIKCGAHIIFGLPGETVQMMFDEVNILSNLPLDTVKFHQLQIIKDTAMEREFTDKPQDFHVFDVEEYIDFFVKFAERLNPEIVVERFVGEAPPRYLSQSAWSLLRNDRLIAMFEKRLEELDTYQGKYFFDMKRLNH